MRKNLRGLVGNQIKHHLNSDLYKNRYQFFLKLPNEAQAEYFLHNELLIHGLGSLEFNLISGLSLSDDNAIKSHQKKCLKNSKNDLIMWIEKLHELLLDVEKKL